MKKIIFTDTNKLYGALKRFTEQGFLQKESTLLQLKNNMKNDIRIMIDEYVVGELIKTCIKNGFSISRREIIEFSLYAGIFILPNKDISTIGYNVYDYTSDNDDVQILVDAVEVSADILLTHNLQDFMIEKIYRDFNIVVTDTIPDEFFI